MSVHLKLEPGKLTALRQIDPRLVSYNIEMTEVTGGTFWKAYSPEVVAGTKKFEGVKSMSDTMSLMQYYPPIDSTNPRLRKLAKELGSAWVRVSGTWSTKTYYDFDGKAGGVSPAGYQNLLTKAQWLALLDFVKAVDGKLMISVANCQGLHSAGEPWNPSQAEQIFALSKEQGVPIEAAEFMNEPNMLAYSGAPDGYTAADYARDQDAFFAWVRANYPECLLVGPCGVDGEIGPTAEDSAPVAGGGIGDIMPGNATTDELMQGTKEPLDVYSYHYYNGVSERLEAIMPSMHWQPEQAHTEAYLAVAGNSARHSAPKRDQYCPGGQMWVTESGDAGGGGCTWASTYLDVLRTLNELGEFASITDGVIFHNTLASSDYGYLQHGSFEPRPNYFAVLLWNRLMGSTVYDAGQRCEGAHIYAHSRKDGKPGAVYLIINNSITQATTVTLPCDALRYTLSAPTLRSKVMQLNGKDLLLGENDTLPALDPVPQPAGTLELAPASCTFLVV